MLNLIAVTLLSSLAPGFADLSSRCAPSVHPITMAAVVSHESAFRPFAIGLNHTSARLPRQPVNAAEAEATARWLDTKGFNFDSGLGQLNSRNRGFLRMSYSDLFDPCANLRGAARVLADCYQKAGRSGLTGQPALHGALSCYATGNLRDGLRNGYVKSVARARVLAIPALSLPPVVAVPVPAAQPVPLAARRQGVAIVPPVAPLEPPVAVSVVKAVSHSGEPDVFGAGDSEVFSAVSRASERGVADAPRD